MKFSTKALHVGQSADPATGATIVPIYQTATFTQDGVNVTKGYDYSRTGNPTRTALEKVIAALEEGKHGLAFASGMAAEAAVTSILRPGDHVVAGSGLYGGTYRLFEKVLRPQQVSFSYVDHFDAESFDLAIRPQTKLIWIETPTNPLLRLIDIAALAAVAKARGVALAVDNTFASPYLQRPLTLGATVVVHSTTKYIAGHSDVVGGAVVTNDAKLFEAIAFHQNAVGAIPGPFDAWLTLRGIKTLAVRMKQHELNAKAVAEFLSGHPGVEKVHYPGLPSHPGHELAKRQMSGFGGMVSFSLTGGAAKAERFLLALKVFSLAESLGGAESLACSPAAMTHASVPPEERLRQGITQGLVRLSVGIEDADDLIEDLEQALSVAGEPDAPSHEI